jgi:hypothetical protein
MKSMAVENIKKKLRMPYWNDLDKLVSDLKKNGIITHAVINNWYMHEHCLETFTHEVRQWSGLRVPGCGEGSPTAQHYKGGASDMLCFKDGKRVDSETIRQYIIKNQKKYLNIKGIELGVSWVHTDDKERAPRLWGFYNPVTFPGKKGMQL